MLLVDHHKKYVVLSYIQYSFRSFQLTANLLTVVSDRIAWAFNKAGLLEQW